MSKDKEISATAKLLEIIRSDGESAETAPPKPDNLSAHNASPKEQSQEEEILLDLHIASPESSTPEPTKPLDTTKDKDEPILTLELEQPDTKSPPSPPPPEDSHPPQSAETAPQPTLEVKSADSKEEKEEVEDDDLDNHITKLSGQLSTEENQISSKKPAAKKLPSAFSKLKLARKKKIGIDIQPTCINIARLDQNNQEAKVSNFLAVTIPAQEEKESGPFYERAPLIETLSANLSLFCEGAKNPEIWCTFESKRIKILNVIIPKIPSKEIPNAVLWATKKEVEFDLAEYLFDYRIIKEIEDGKLKKIITLVYLFHKEEIQGVTAMFQKIGFPLTGITHYSSAINNILQKNYLADDNIPTVHLTFEKPTAHIDVYCQGTLLFTREIKTGVSSYTESVFDLAGEKDLVLDDQSAFEMTFDRCKTLIPYSAETESSSENNTLLDITKISTNDRLIRQVSRTFDFCSTNFKIPRVSKLFNSGCFTLKKPLLDEIQSELDVECAVIDIFSLDQDRLQAIESLQNSPENLNPSPAYGLTLANNSNTQNFLFTYADKTRHLQESRSNQLISIFTIALALILGSVAFFNYQNLKGKQSEINTLRENLMHQYQGEPRSKNTTYALTTTNAIETIIKETNDKATRFRIIALVNEITSQTPDSIKLTELTIDLRKKTPPAKSKKDKGKKANNSVSVKGFASGPQKKQNFVLLGFQKALVQQVSINSAKIAERDNMIYQGDEILKFNILVEPSKGIMK